MKRFPAKEKMFGIWKEHKSKRELDLNEREKNVLLKEKELKTLSIQLTMQKVINEEKIIINERKVLDKKLSSK